LSVETLPASKNGLRSGDVVTPAPLHRTQIAEMFNLPESTRIILPEWALVI
jgi:hypothetical protein